MEEDWYFLIDYFKYILICLFHNLHVILGHDVKPPGYPVGKGLSSAAAKELGLLEGMPVGTSIIDAHAGGLGMLGCSANNISADFTTRLGIYSFLLPMLSKNVFKLKIQI